MDASCFRWIAVCIELSLRIIRVVMYTGKNYAGGLKECASELYTYADTTPPRRSYPGILGRPRAELTTSHYRSSTFRYDARAPSLHVGVVAGSRAVAESKLPLSEGRNYIDV